MTGIYNSITEIIGHTPMLKLNGFMALHSLEASVIAKLEYLNPGGSMKDRVAYNMILDAEEKGLLKPGATIIEPTSGNTGIGLALVCAARGYKAVLTMPDSMSPERRKLLAAYGAELVLTDGSLSMRGAIEKARELAENTPNSFMPGQFENPANPDAHTLSTGPEIWADTGGDIDILIAGVGTGGSISGTGKYLREKKPGIRIVAVEPADSPVLSGGEPGPHGLQGIGAGFVPNTLNTRIYDEIIKVKTAEAYTAAREAAKAQGILIGVSSGAALFAAREQALRKENKGANIIVILPDSGERYLSTGLFDS